MRIFISGLLFILLANVSAFGATLKSEGAAEALSEEVMLALQNNDINDAFEKMKLYMDISDDNFEASTAKSIARHNEFKQRFGKTIGYEFIGGKMIGTSLLRLQYLEKKDNYALRWSFYYFKTPKGWRLNTFSWEGDIKSFF